MTKPASFLLVWALLATALPVEAEETIDLTRDWRFAPDPEGAGAASAWGASDLADSSWAVIDAGVSWESQGYPDLDGHGWYRKRVFVPAAWRGKKVWLAFGAVNDCYTLYCNGRQLASYGDKATYSTSRIGTITEISAGLQFGEDNLIAVDVFDWARSGGLWKPPCLMTTDPAELPVALEVQAHLGYEDARLTVGALLTGLSPDRHEGTFAFALWEPDGRSPLAVETTPFSRNSTTAWATFELPRRRAETEYVIRLEAVGAHGELVPGTVTETSVTWPGRFQPPPEYANAEVLNNFVAELARAKCPRNGRKTVGFVNPREGWVFLALEDRRGDAIPNLSLDSEAVPLALRPYPGTSNLEAMRYLDAGEHVLTVINGGGRLVVRAVPLLAYCRYPGEPSIKRNGPYDWAFLSQYVLSNVNTITTHSDNLPPENLDEWAREGRQWIDQARLAGLHQPDVPTPEEVYAEWKDKPGATDPRFGGLIVDEFINSGTIEYYTPWTAGLELLSADPNFADKTFYAWCGLMARFDATRDFRRAIVAHDHRFVWEQYFHEQDCLEQARCYMLRRLVGHTREWLKDDPDAARHIVQCLGLFCMPPGTLNLRPDVDFKVHMDMQFRYLATEPFLWGQCGVLPWVTNYADEEVLRWTYRLFRHYCIEGNRTPLTGDPYVLPHIQNPDFNAGSAHWGVEAAEPGAVEVVHIEGFGSLQGRYPRTVDGDCVLRLKRSPSGPSEVRQRITQLEPGRLYSVKIIAVDTARMQDDVPAPLRLVLDGVEPLADRSFVDTFRGKQLAASGEVDFEFRNPYMTYHRVVFRALSGSAELILSDEPAPAGHELLCNFVEVQPYFSEAQSDEFR